MKSKQPLSDSWLFWDAERLDEFPHVSEHDGAPTAAAGEAEAGGGGSSPRNLLEELLLYVGGVSAAVIGMGLVIMTGSFISAYSALSGSGESRHGAAPARTYPEIQRPEPYAKSAPPEAIVLGPGRAGTGIGGGEASPRGAAAFIASRRAPRARAELIRAERVTASRPYFAISAVPVEISGLPGVPLREETYRGELVSFLFVNRFTKISPQKCCN